jgi:hypothetical protein
MGIIQSFICIVSFDLSGFLVVGSSNIISRRGSSPKKKKKIYATCWVVKSLLAKLVGPTGWLVILDGSHFFYVLVKIDTMFFGVPW